MNLIEAVIISGPRKGEIALFKGEPLPLSDAESAFDAAIDSAQIAARKEREVAERINAARDDVRRLTEIVGQLDARIVRLEAQRDANRAHIEATLAQFRAEVERAELRLSRQLPPATT